jgi:DNA helicase-2/ATP-dependent DNA helicase PcrA
MELPDALIKEILPEGDFHLQEERRLFYVGMTRAKEELFLTSAADYGGQRLRRLSQFVTEALGNKLTPKEIKTDSLQAIARFAPQKETKKKLPTALSTEKMLSLSYYQIDDYLTCPLKYRYVNILRVPIMEHHTVIYGRAMHEAVCKFFQQRLSGKEMHLAALLDTFASNFDPQGFLAEAHQEQRFRIGKEALTKFYHAEQEKRSQPLYVEKDFSFILENNKISGRFDRLDQEKEGVVIIDFKTSEITTQKKADEKAKENKQLALYALACKNVFGKLPARGELHFLESGLVGTKGIEEDDLQEIIADVRKVSSGIRQLDFSAKPAYMACTYCAYNQVCPSANLR